MPEIKERLAETSQECLKAYDAWRGDEKSDKNREQLLDTIHELRKVASRLEIELAISERDNNAAKPLPIPPHRASRKKSGDAQGNDNPAAEAEEAGGQPQDKPRRRRAPRKAAEG